MILRFVFATFATLLLSATLPAQTASDQHREFPAFKIAGNLYYVGTADLAVYLIHTPEGNILINSDFPQDVPLIKKSIASLGFKYEDTKILLLSHAHNDHDQAMGIIHKETGAKLMVMDGDAQEEESTAPGRPATHVDRVLHDGDTVELGGSKWIAKLTPGHTKGCTTWITTIREGNRDLHVVIVGSPNINAFSLVANKEYPQIADDYVKGFAVLHALPCDLFLGAHGSYFGLMAKYDRFKAGDKNAFIDPEGYKTYITERERLFHEEWDRQKKNPGAPAPKK
jgi:metallo-beta-lactamase class B